MSVRKHVNKFAALNKHFLSRCFHCVWLCIFVKAVIEIKAYKISKKKQKSDGLSKIQFSEEFGRGVGG